MDGDCCNFPFVYKGNEQNSCIGSGRKWCATTYNYDQDKKWGWCGGKNLRTVSRRRERLSMGDTNSTRVLRCKPYR